MLHRVAGRKLGRTTAHREAMLANMAASLAIHGRIETTLPKAKELRHIADRLITLGKRGTVAARRRAMQLVRDNKAVARAFAELAPRFAQRQGGYTRVLKLGYRHGDSAPMAMIEYIPAEHEAGAEGLHDAKKPATHRKPLARKATANKAAKPAVHKPAAHKAASHKGEQPAAHKAASKGKKAPAAAKAKKSGRGD